MATFKDKLYNLSRRIMKASLSQLLVTIGRVTVMCAQIVTSDDLKVQPGVSSSGFYAHIASHKVKKHSLGLIMLCRGD